MSLNSFVMCYLHTVILYFQQLLGWEFETLPSPPPRPREKSDVHPAICNFNSSCKLLVVDSVNRRNYESICCVIRLQKRGLEKRVYDCFWNWLLNHFWNGQLSQRVMIVMMMPTLQCVEVTARRRRLNAIRIQVEKSRPGRIVASLASEDIRVTSPPALCLLLNVKCIQVYF